MSAGRQGQVAVDPRTQPVWYASDRERGNGKPMACGLEADEPEWLGPEAGHDEQIGGAEERNQPGRVDPAPKLDSDLGSRPASPVAVACQAARAGPSPANVTSSLRLSALATRGSASRK